MEQKSGLVLGNDEIADFEKSAEFDFSWEQYCSAFNRHLEMWCYELNYKKSPAELDEHAVKLEVYLQNYKDTVFHLKELKLRLFILS